VRDTLKAAGPAFSEELGGPIAAPHFTFSYEGHYTSSQEGPVTDRKPVFILGQELTYDELRQAHQRIKGAPLPGNLAPRDVVRWLAQTLPLRFEFEVNRCRGHAWDAEELG